ncbi:Uncharacterised protein [Yersinia intermedia]|nr:Uncharacterised protein [Yersinia intermedia]
MRKLNFQTTTYLIGDINSRAYPIGKNWIHNVKLLRCIHAHSHFMDPAFIFFLAGNHVVQINQLLNDGVIHGFKRLTTNDVIFNMMVAFLSQTQCPVHVI